VNRAPSQDGCTDSRTGVYSAGIAPTRRIRQRPTVGGAERCAGLTSGRTCRSARRLAGRKSLRSAILVRILLRLQLPARRQQCVHVRQRILCATPLIPLSAAVALVYHVKFARITYLCAMDNFSDHSCYFLAIQHYKDKQASIR